MEDWKKTEEELPSCDGYYHITNFPDNPFDLATLFYDGYGFSQRGIYYEPNYWRKINLLEKKYGKVIKS